MCTRLICTFFDRGTGGRWSVNALLGHTLQIFRVLEHCRLQTQ